MGTVSPEEFTTKHQANVSAIHSTQIIVLVFVLVFVLVKAISLQGVHIPLITARLYTARSNPMEYERHLGVMTAFIQTQNK